MYAGSTLCDVLHHVKLQSEGKVAELKGTLVEVNKQVMNRYILSNHSNSAV
jgi:hypothetical protein